MLIERVVFKLCVSRMTHVSAPPAEDLVKQWESEQECLRQQVVEDDTEDWQRSPGFSGLERIGGVDLSFIKGDDERACAQLVVLSFPDLKILYEDSQMVTLTAPYIAGFLAFRETPFLLEALQRLKMSQPSLMPQVVFVDGNGLFHYREFGLACHLGVLSGLPCVGVAKNLLQVQGVYKNEEHQSQIAALQKGGDGFPLTADSGKVLGKALRSSDKSSKPVYVSVGHKISLDTAVRLTHSCCRYRVPEPIRQADCRSREYLRKHFPAADTHITE
ncbi:endonuclease V-like isoform 2-T2 [Odontesthes bonariensis]|uniref:endonuclease V-like isoform X2 n=1 Tax=Odontesthes bonariensis TaxID=219752 RepID=UPI003F58BEE8